MLRRFSLLLAVGLWPLAANAQDPVPADSIMIAGTCHVHAASRRDRTREIDRIELQVVRFRTMNGKAIGGPRVRIGVQPKGGDELIPSDISAPCTGSGDRLSCAMRCEDASGARELGRFRIEPAGATALRLHIDSALTLDACSPGETPFQVPASLVGRTFTLTRRPTSECFH